LAAPVAGRVRVLPAVAVRTAGAPSPSAVPDAVGVRAAVAVGHPRAAPAGRIGVAAGVAVALSFRLLRRGESHPDAGHGRSGHGGAEHPERSASPKTALRHDLPIFQRLLALLAALVRHLRSSRAGWCALTHPSAVPSISILR